ncbi:hypothetical protein BJV78DRAFT_1123285, partial [Lactifluus subvellereus]
VKFTRRYFLPLHQFCAERGHEPQSLGHGVLHDSWQVVVVERIGHNVLTLRDHEPMHLSTWSRDLRQLVDEFHARGWVHGDLRDANLIISKDDPGRVILVDFDWSGDAKSGLGMYYPTVLLNEELVNPEDPDDLEITKEGDKRVLDATLKKLNESSLRR